MWTTKTLIRQHGRACWFESSLGAHVRMLVCLRSDLYQPLWHNQQSNSFWTHQTINDCRNPNFQDNCFNLQFCNHCIYPADTQRWNDVYSTLIQRKDIESTLFRRCVPAECNPKYSDTLTPYHSWSNFWTSQFCYFLMCLEIAIWVTNSSDPDQTPHYVTSDLGLHYMIRRVCSHLFFFFSFFFFFLFFKHNGSFLIFYWMCILKM